MPTQEKTYTGTARRGRAVENARGEAAVYELDPPCEGHRFVVVSAIDLPSIGGPRGSETKVFPSDGVTFASFLELASVCRWSHADALASLGYEVMPS